MQKITRDQLKTLLESRKGAYPLTLMTITKPGMVKTNNPFWGNIEKVSVLNGFAGWNYTNSVNRGRIKEEKLDDFEPAPRTWGQRLPGSPLVEYQGELYLEMRVGRRQTSFLTQNPKCPVALNEITPFLTKHTEGTRQNLEKPVVLRDYSLSSIRVVRMDGEDYLVESQENETSTIDAWLALL